MLRAGMQMLVDATAERACSLPEAGMLPLAHPVKAQALHQHACAVTQPTCALTRSTTMMPRTSTPVYAMCNFFCLLSAWCEAICPGMLHVPCTKDSQWAVAGAPGKVF
jgi:hypothetical protein